MTKKKLILEEVEDIRTVFVAEFGKWLSMKCPFCECENLHVKEAYTKIGTDEAEAEIYGGTTVKGVSEGWRRSALAIVMFCEDGHLFEFILQQHKGVTFLRWEGIGEYRWWEEKKSSPEPLLMGAKRKFGKWVANL